MSTTASPQTPMSSGTDQQEIRIVSHSTLFYWWPVWVVGFIMALITAIDGSRVAIVPDGTVPRTGSRVEGVDGLRDVLILPDGRKLPVDPSDNQPVKPYLHMSQSKNLGVLYATVLLLVILITNVPLRGLWSLVVIVVVILMSVIFALANWWEKIFEMLGNLAVHINMGGYVIISLGLFAMWLFSMLLFDRQIYMVFTPGQLRVCTEIGGGEVAYDTQGMVIQKERSDLFRHWILGLGSGDLVVRTAGANTHEFHFHNVLFVGHKLKMIEEMQRDRPVVRGSN